MRHIISLLIENESGALSRVAGLFSARGYNIESLNVAMTEDASLSRMTLVTNGSEQVVEQIVKQLNKLIDVVKLIEFAETTHIERELMMVKVKTSSSTRHEIRSLAEIFRGKILDVTATTYVIEVTGPSEKLDAFVAAIEPSTIIEVVRSGPTGISRGEKGLSV
ncbi:acetolactate synthase small subunit [Methylovulum psychrotolerans]|uniref:Acetolactate synthase small subunit n=1 Tax=Methylovulum psychrotolerans TaxID=1704499 RepID=A0A1Z4BYC5_9GAMM|nr:acetolactate synthase small subunit [Methylovulum psychrotolerans]ASF46261.1 acetolactate synthase small subunit [Methylovulum psychrotolerans]MBT9097019.1 acetolactate synthase small subunit [Methylovulum psychrotolerans]POZ51204.1 acetolactate synthase small subunit [Methylovulum psychrotolerans]